MLEIKIPGIDFFDESTNEFATSNGFLLTLEHSLLSVSKWEAKWKIPFLAQQNFTDEQLLDYIVCMTIGKAPEYSQYKSIPKSSIQEISDYIADPMTATTFRTSPGDRPSREIITSELIYYWMVGMNIPFECQKWHLNRLLTLIRVTSLKNGPEKKMSRSELAEHNRQLNAERLAKYNTKG